MWTVSRSWTRWLSVPLAEAETVRKMIVAMSHDPALVIKVCDRLHKHHGFLPPEKQAKKARKH